MGESVRTYMMQHSAESLVLRGEELYQIDAVDTMGDPSTSSGQVQGKAALRPAQGETDSQYDVVYHVAGIAHVNADLF